jgi:mannosyltransferase OCH1-like enzyme
MKSWRYLVVALVVCVTFLFLAIRWEGSLALIPNRSTEASTLQFIPAFVTKLIHVGRNDQTFRGNHQTAQILNNTSNESWLNTFNESRRHFQEHLLLETQNVSDAKTGSSPFPPSDNNSTPPFLHFIHVRPMLKDPCIVPNDVNTTINGWQTLHPNWTITVWTNQRVRESFPDLVPTLERIQEPSWMSDLLRYAVLSRFGGFYSDTGIQFVSFSLRSCV